MQLLGNCSSGAMFAKPNKSRWDDVLNSELSVCIFWQILNKNNARHWLSNKCQKRDTFYTLNRTVCRMPVFVRILVKASSSGVHYVSKWLLVIIICAAVHHIVAFLAKHPVENVDSIHSANRSCSSAFDSKYYVCMRYVHRQYA